jgi:hypothetical protein
MPSIRESTKRLQINKANAVMAFTVAGAAFVATFSLVASQALFNQRSYQGRVIKAKETARNQLKANITVANGLESSYKNFISSPNNVLGGNPTGTGDHDGDNGKIVLDALPSKYDYPALVSSLEKLVTSSNYKIISITGLDDSLGQKDKESSSSPIPVEMPFVATVAAKFDATKELMGLFEKSIRPMNVQSLDVTANDKSEVQLTITAKSYYQPAKSLNIEKKVVR